MDGHRPPPAVVGPADRDLKPQATVLGQDERRLERQFLQHRAPCLVGGPHGEVQQRRSRHQSRTPHGVIGEPRLRLQREPAGQDDLVVGEGERGPEQGVVGGVEAGGTDVGGGARCRVHPVRPALEGVGGQVGVTVADPEEGQPVDGQAVGVGVGDGGEEAGPAALVAAQRTDGEGAGFFQDLVDRVGEDGVGAALDECGVARGGRGPERVGEADGPAEIGVPVAGVEAGGVHEFAGDRGVERDRAGTGRDAGQGAGEVVLEGLDVPGVGGVVDVDPAGADLLPRTVGEELVESMRVTRDHRGVDAVVGRDGDLLAPGGDQLRGPVVGEGHGDHAAEPGDLQDGPAAQRGDPGPVLQGERTRHHGGRDLALGMADDGGGLDAEGAPQGGEGDHHREQGRLDDVHAGQLPAMAQDFGE